METQRRRGRRKSPPTAQARLLETDTERLVAIAERRGETVRETFRTMFGRTLDRVYERAVAGAKS